MHAHTHFCTHVRTRVYTHIARAQLREDEATEGITLGKRHRVGLCVDMCMDMCMDMCIDVCMDMRIEHAHRACVWTSSMWADDWQHRQCPVADRHSVTRTPLAVHHHY